MRRRRQVDCTPSPRPVAFTSPVMVPSLEMTVSAQGSFDDADGISRTVKVRLTRMIEDPASAASRAAHGERARELLDGCAVEISGEHIIDDAFEIDPSQPEIAFRSEAGLRAFTALLVAACAEAEHRGILGSTPPVAAGGLR